MGYTIGKLIKQAGRTYSSLKKKAQSAMAPIKPSNSAGISSRRLSKQIDIETGEPLNQLRK